MFRGAPDRKGDDSVGVVFEAKLIPCCDSDNGCNTDKNTQKEYASDRDLLPKGNTHTPDPRNGKAKNYEIDEQICNSAPFIEKG